MFENTKNTKAQGTVGIGSAISYFTSIGYTVSIPLNDSQSYDLIIDDGKSLSKVQVKTASYKTKYGIYSVLLKTCGGNQSRNTIKLFDRTLVEFLFVLTSDNERYLIPTKDFDAKNNFNLGKKYKKYIVKEGDPHA